MPNTLGSGVRTRRPPPRRTAVGVSQPDPRRQGSPEPPSQQIYWMRHGDTKVPTTRTSGGFDTPLSDHGREQVRTNASALKDHGIVPAIIISSQMVRAVQSSEIAAEVLGCEMIVVDGPLLNEQDWAGQGRETTEDLQRRAFRVARELRRFEVTPLLIVSHGRLGAAVVRTYRGTALDSAVMSIDHGQIIRLQPLPVVWL